MARLRAARERVLLRDAAREQREGTETRERTAHAVPDEHELCPRCAVLGAAPRSEVNNSE